MVVGDAKLGTYSGIMNVIKYFPIAAVVEFEGNRELDAVSLAEFAFIPASEVIDMPIKFSVPFDPGFPEAGPDVDPRYLLLAGRGYSDCIERAESLRSVPVS